MKDGGHVTFDVGQTGYAVPLKATMQR